MTEDTGERPWRARLLREQRAARVAALSGTTASLVVPISDRLITGVAGRQFSASVRDLEIRAADGNQFSVAVGLRKLSWLSRINLQLVSERQPDFPDAPVVVSRLLLLGVLAGLGGVAARLLDTLPPWLHINGDRLQIDLAALLRHYDAAEALSYIRRVAITARKGAMILALDAQIPLNDVKYRATRTRVLTC